MKPSKPLVVGLTGTIGSGKSTCSEILSEKFNLPVIDADKIAYEVSKKGSDGLAKIIEVFGEDYLLENGEYDRKKMSETVFNDPEALAKLNSIIHPFIKEEKERQLEKLANEEIIIYDCPLLFEADENKTVDQIIVITSDDLVRNSRISQRSGLTEEEIKKRINNQDSEEKKISQADYVIYNNGSKEDLEHSLDQIVKNLKKC